MNRTTDEALLYAEPVIEALKQKVCTPADMIDIMHFEHNKLANTRITQILTTVSRYYPVYEPSNKHYRILTKELLDEYEEAHTKKIKIEEYNWE